MDKDYKVLYRKYRPANFDEVVGQKYTISMLKNAIINEKLAHAYIFTGPRGTGKTSTAKIFAKTINCESLINGLPCGKCNSCQNNLNNADIIEIDAASNNGVDEIRELINNVKIAPSFSKYKVYIIDEVHMLSQSAFNALLLTLEEPPAHIVFILATTNIESVPITILSRCQRYDFKKLEDEEIINHLKLIAEKEKIEIADEAIEEITYLSDGGLRDALSILNQLSTSNNMVKLETVLENYGSVSILKIKSIVSAYLEGNYDSLKAIFDELSSESIDYKNFIKKMVDELFLRALELKMANDPQKFASVKKIVFALNDLLNKINLNVDPFLLVFMIFIEDMAINEEKTANVVSIQENVQKEDNLVFDEKLNDERITFLEKLIPVRINNCFVEADKNNLKVFKENWQKFIMDERIENDMKSLIVDCEVVLASAKINIVINSQKSLVELFNKNLIDIENKYKNLLNLDIKFLALTGEDWNKEKSDYVRKIKEGYSYQLMDEPILEKKWEESDIINENKLNNDIMDIFDKEKLVIQ